MCTYQDRLENSTWTCTVCKRKACFKQCYLLVGTNWFMSCLLFLTWFMSCLFFPDSPITFLTFHITILAPTKSPFSHSVHVMPGTHYLSKCSVTSYYPALTNSFKCLVICSSVFFFLSVHYLIVIIVF